MTISEIFFSILHPSPKLINFLYFITEAVMAQISIKKDARLFRDESPGAQQAMSLPFAPRNLSY
jgi:hypothetical protein